MPKLARWSTPARTADKNLGQWSATVSATFRPYVADCRQFYDPTETNTPAGTPEPMLSWPAFPARLRGPNRFAEAETDRRVQDEYGE